jgi:hypothetical protein
VHSNVQAEPAELQSKLQSDFPEQAIAHWLPVEHVSLQSL